MYVSVRRSCRCVPCNGRSFLARGDPRGSCPYCKGTGRRDLVAWLASGREPEGPVTAPARD